MGVAENYVEAALKNYEAPNPSRDTYRPTVRYMPRVRTNASLEGNDIDNPLVIWLAGLDKMSGLTVIKKHDYDVIYVTPAISKRFTIGDDGETVEFGVQDQDLPAFLAPGWEYAGFVRMSKNMPWLAFSSDGVLKENGERASKGLRLWVPIQPELARIWDKKRTEGAPNQMRIITISTVNRKIFTGEEQEVLPLTMVGPWKCLVE
ncbi:hypothetical protein CSR02_15155 [Acetobacter pomorum]|uniref:Uncharacterized protein n=1 Tax=Acetobacter pomorum TaxID=65959 RepID=A0A2G4RAH9_9PROT|nr:hypothetical protein CSR02_15155 [Acetobacter pomorum]GBR52941.1 hypothetical protein AA11825_2372 [Acetobacter pomorum DSM 11825]